MMDMILMMVGAATLLLICIGVLLYWGGILSFSIDGKRTGKGKK